MISYRHVRTLSLIRSAAFSCLITAPATGFFILFMCLAFNNSLADTFLKQARSLVSDVPTGMVRECIQAKTTVPEPPEVHPSALNACKTTFIGEDEWKDSVDLSIRQLYLTFVVLGLLCWLFAENGMKGLFAWLRDIKRKPLH